MFEVRTIQPSTLPKLNMNPKHDGEDEFPFQTDAFFRFHMKLWEAIPYITSTTFVTKGTVELEIMQHARMTLAKSPPGTTVGGW